MLVSMSDIDPRADAPLVDWSELGVSGLLPTGTVTLLLADVVGAKLRLDGTPTPRSRVARMTKRPTPAGAGQERLPWGGSAIREYCNAKESFLRVVWPRSSHALGHKEIAVASASVGTLDSAPVAADYCYLINTTIVTMAK